MFGWSGSLLRIDLSDRTYRWESISPYTDKFIGGRGVNVKLIFDEVKSGTHPFHADNRLLFGPGVLTGTPAPSASRTQLTAILPNGLLASSGIGGYIGFEIRHAGCDNLVIQGKSEVPTYVFIRDGLVEFHDAAHLRGMSTKDTQQAIREEIGDPDLQIACIGPAGENLVSFACVMTGMGSAAGHGGFGAIMGSKNLKAVAVRGKGEITIAHLDGFLDLCLATRTNIQKSPAWQAMIDSEGKTSAPVAVQNGVAAFGNLEDAYDIGVIDELTTNGNQFWERYRVGRTGCAGCPVHHFGVFNVPGCGIGAPKCASWASFAMPIWNTDYEVMFRAGNLCNDYGLDFVSTANIIGFLMVLQNDGIISKRDSDGILMSRGNPEAIITTIHKIAKQEGFGKLFRNGLLEAAACIGKGAENYALQIKQSEMVVQETRHMKSMALAYAVTKDPLDAVPIAEMAWFDSKTTAEEIADMLCGHKEAANPESYSKKALLVSAMQERIIAAEMLGLCKWYLVNLTPSLETPAKLFSLATGKDLNELGLLEAARRVRVLERSVNVLRGNRREDDTLPNRLFDSPITNGPFAGAIIDKNKFETMINEYYQVCGWDEDGIPKEETFRNLGLGEEWQIFKSKMAEKAKYQD